MLFFDFHFWSYEQMNRRISNKRLLSCFLRISWFLVSAYPLSLDHQNFIMFYRHNIFHNLFVTMKAKTKEGKLKGKSGPIQCYSFNINIYLCY